VWCSQNRYYLWPDYKRIDNAHEFYTPSLDGGIGRMIEFAVLPTALQAALVVTLVLIEAIGLYVGYGMIEDRVAPQVFKAIANTA